MRIKLKCPHCGRHQLRTVQDYGGTLECGDCHRAISYRARKPVQTTQADGDAVEMLKKMFGGFK